MLAVGAMLCFMANRNSPTIITILYLNPITIFACRDKEPFDCIRRTEKDHIIGLIRIGLPLRTVSTAHPLGTGQYKTSFYNDTTSFG